MILKNIILHCKNTNYRLQMIVFSFLIEKEEKLDNATNGTEEDGWVSPSKQPGSPRCSHSRHGSNASASSAHAKKWVDLITGVHPFLVSKAFNNKNKYLF